LLIVFGDLSASGLLAGGGTTVSVWNWGPEVLTAAACDRLRRNLTWEGWHEYLGDEPYRKTCPNLPDGEGVPVVQQFKGRK
jgi:hypothetical protein